ncbi:MAG: TIGR00159 family protein [Ruminococcaceae bacterium]|nr:TIGR00159 family protein [Oscillospiraceae bacterium]
MNSVFDAIYSIWNQIIFAISNLRIPFDIIDILAMAYIIYKAIGFLRETRAGQLVKGLVILFVVYALAGWWKLATIQWVLSRVVDSAIIAAAVIFQPELRRLLERVGRTNFSKSQIFDSKTNRLAECISSVCKAAATMQEKRIGALIVFERTTQLGEIINTGTVIDAESSVSIINNIFFPKSPLHDGAMIIREGRIYAAACILPLTQRQDISAQLGTRHRAAIGMTENSDAVVLVVSEETGIISIVSNGQITRNYSAVSAEAELMSILVESDQNKKGNNVKQIINKILPNKKSGKDEGNDETA